MLSKKQALYRQENVQKNCGNCYVMKILTNLLTVQIFLQFIWYDYYSHLFVSQNIPPENNNDNTLSFISNNFDGSILNERISDEEIIKSIKRSKKNK